MLLEIENQLHRRVHSKLGQSAVVMRLAEEIDQSGRVAEQTMIVVSYVGENTNNPNEGAYIPTVRNRSLNYSITIIQKQVQREGHSFALPLMDLIFESVTGWVPKVPGLEFQTGFEPGPAKLVKVTDSSQFIYEMNFSIQILIVDGRFYSQPCAAFDPINLDNFLPRRSCLLTPDGENTGLAVWRRKIGATEEEEEYIVEDPTCARKTNSKLELFCAPELNGNATYRFIPHYAVSYTSDGDQIIDESKVISGSLTNVWKCTGGGGGDGGPYPPWGLKIDSGIWRNLIGTVPNTDEDTSARQPLIIKTKPAE